MGTPVHNINEILLKVVLNTISLTINTNLATMQFERVNYFKKKPSFLNLKSYYKTVCYEDQLVFTL
jgi:hypothetical protein